MNANARRGPGDPPSLTSGARRISPEHLSRLRVIVSRAGSIHAAFPLLKTSPDVVADALTQAVFRARTAAALEEKIDRIHRELDVGGDPSTT